MTSVRHNSDAMLLCPAFHPCRCALDVAFACLPTSRLPRFALPATLLILLLALSGGVLDAEGQVTIDGASSTVTNVTSLPQPHEGSAPRMILEGVRAGNIYEVNRTVEVIGQVHGVMVFGGDVIVRGRIEGDVATIGGSIFQTEGSYIGGDVIVLGGAYHHGKTAPWRNAASTTVMVAGFEDELREMARQPSSLLSPRPSLQYFGGRLLAVLFWFIVSLALTAVVPGAVSRAGTRLQLTSLRVALIGFVSLVVIVCGVPLSLRFLPAPLAGFVGILALILLALAYMFGRVALHAVTGQMLQRRLFAAHRQSETTALLLGTSFWVLLLSLPYLWTLVVGGLFVVSLGLALTARSPMIWRHGASNSTSHARK